MKYIYLSFLILFSSILNAQNQIDSLEALLPNKKGLEKVETLNKLAYSYWSISPDKGLSYANMAYSIALTKDSKTHIAKSLQNIGICYWAKSELHLALENYQKSLKIYGEIKDLKGTSSSYSNMGIVYKDLSDYENAAKYYFKALKIAEQNEFTNLYIRTFSNLSSV